MRNIAATVWRLAMNYKWYLAVTAVFAAALYGYSFFQSDSATETQSFSVVQAVDRGKVSSGIETTGEIVAAQKLDLDVYKQLSRIDVVNIQNGSHVEKDKVLISFDKSDVMVDTRSSAVSVAEAELGVAEASENANDPNTEIRTLENQIAEYEKAIDDARTDFLNENLTAEPGDRDTKDKTRPTVSGQYNGTTQGEYRIEIYRSAAESRYSYRVSGLETASATYYPSIAMPVGSSGLKITIPAGLQHGDVWIIAVPNTYASTYAASKTNYDTTVAGLKVDIANAKQELADLRLTDTNSYRNLDVEKAQLSLSEARQQLSENYEAIGERDIVAPFAGTIQDMANVVVGATPTGGTEDSISLGTLVSDEYLATFTLDAADAARVTVGQKVEVAITSYPSQPTFEATITEVSSLPSAEGVAQYDVRAKLNYDAQNTETVLREGMLADIVVVQQEKEDALRVPTSAITYENGQPTVQVIDSLTPDQQAQFDQMGIVRTDRTALATYPVTITLGVEGRFYTEIMSGLEEGQLILTTVSTTAGAVEPTVQSGLGGPSGGVRIQNEQGGSTDGAGPGG